MLFSEEFIYKLKENNPIETVMSSYVNLKRTGHDFLCCCPFHSEKTPSCRIYTNDGHFYCFGCHVGGDVISFIKRAENLEYIDAIRFLAEKSGMEVPDSKENKNEISLRKRVYEINRESANFFFKTLVSGNDKRGLSYFALRKITPATVKKYGLGFAPIEWDSLYKHLKSLKFSDEEILTSGMCRQSKKNPNSIYDFFRNRVMFPIVDLRGNIIAFGGRVLDDSMPKYLNSPDTPVFNKRLNIFSLNHAKNSASKRLILAEGYMDVIALNQAGFENTVATLGTALTQEQARIIKKYADEVVIAYDSDSAGQNATMKAVNLLGNVGITVRIIKMEGAKDPDEYIKKFGAERFRSLLEHSDGAVNFQLEKCKNGLNLRSEPDKVEYLRRASKILAQISNPLEQNIYISKTADECGMKPEILQNAINKYNTKKELNTENQQWRIIKGTQTMKDMINPDSYNFPKQAKAEDLLILYILRNPDNYEKVYSMITPEQFVTSFNRRVYECICKKINSFMTLGLSIFSDEFTVDEMNRITEMTVQNKDIYVDKKTAEDCIKVILSFDKNNIKKTNKVSDEELIALQKKLMNKDYDN